jgi:hypothetical protein
MLNSFAPSHISVYRSPRQANEVLGPPLVLSLILNRRLAFPVYRNPVRNQRHENRNELWAEWLTDLSNVARLVPKNAHTSCADWTLDNRSP